MKITALLRMVMRKLIPIYEDPYVATTNAWSVLEKLLRTDRLHLIAQDDIELTRDQSIVLELWLKKLSQEHMPLQYILGNVPFLDVIIDVRPPTLIPRPETEEWCEYLLEQLHMFNVQPATILDLCTGSGCIGIALAHKFKKSLVTATDIHQDALNLTAANAKKNNCSNVSAVYSNIYDALDASCRFDLIVANPPYVTQEEWKTLQPQITCWEDPGALVALDNGYQIIEKIIKDARHFLQPASSPVAKLWIEIGSMQGEYAQALMAAHFTRAEIIKDWYGKDRVVLGFI